MKYEKREEKIMDLIAHISNDRREQTVKEHCDNVAVLASHYAEKINMTKLAELEGKAHDLGKLCSDFNEYIRKNNLMVRGEIDHSYPGAKKIFSLASENDAAKATAAMAARNIISHHGLHDWLDTDGNDYFTQRISKTQRFIEISDEIKKLYPDDELTDLLTEAEEEYIKAFSLIKEIVNSTHDDNNVKETKRIKIKSLAFYMGMFERLMQSILIDADRTDTADFMSGKSSELKCNRELLWNNMSAKMDEKCAKFRLKKDKISKQRMDISDRCAAFADHKVGACRLIVPTGGGKTLSSLRFAVNYCKINKMDRIIYIAPFMSILEQNSDEIKSIAGTVFFLEHYSEFQQNIDDDEELKEYQLHTEKWDMPVIATTMVQFFNSLFLGKSSSVRRMHRLCKSVIIIDEVQSIPIKCVYMFNLAVNFLTHFCGSSVILCSATQPQFEKLDYPIILDEKFSMTGDYTKDFNLFKRTELISEITKSGYDFDETASYCYNKYCQSENLLLVVNTKKAAAEIFMRIKDIADERGDSVCVIHLSANMCPQHKRNVIEKMRKLLDKKERLICVTTNLIEAGVDISFKCVVRSLSGLDNAAQAAGRCNRHGENECCNVYLININESLGKLRFVKDAQNISARIIHNNNFDDLLSVDAMSQYFNLLYKDNFNMLSYETEDCDTNTNLIDLLSINSIRSSVFHLPLSCCHQAFATAGEIFNVIDNDTHELIVPYDETAKEIISDLNSELTPNIAMNKLRAAQKYSVSVYPYIYNELLRKNAVYTVKCGVNVLDEGFYDNDFGITVNGKIKPIDMY